MAERGGGWHNAMGTVGGVTRTYGLHEHFSRSKDGLPARITRAELGRVAWYFGPYWREWLLVLFCIAAAAGLNVLPPFCVGRILDRAIPRGDLNLLAWLSAAIVGTALISGLIGVAEQSLTAAIGQSIMLDLRNDIYRHLQKMSLGFFTRTRSGEIVSRINNDVNAVQGVTTATIVTIASNLAALTATSIALFSMSWRLALLAIAIVPAFYLPSRFVGGVRRRISAETQESQASLLAFLNERLHVGGAVLMNIFGQGPADAQEFAQRSVRVRDLSIQQTVVGRWLRLVLSVFSVAGPALIYWYGGRQVIRQEMTRGLLVAFAALLTMLYKPLVQLASVYVDIQASLAVFERIFEYLDMEPEVQDAPDAIRLDHVEGRVTLEGVCFAYPEAPTEPAAEADAEETDAKPRFALRDVSFEIAPGEQVALVGPSGAGKTTITYLVPRFYDPDEGRILLDGRDLRDLDQHDLRRHIGMVTQETFLFHATIRENLLYAKPDASEAELVEACRAANIHDFISALPDGYNTVVGERGFRLSGGEKQRLSIARALLKDPRILILDEATSSLDATSEYLIQTALERLLRGRTSLIIAHRLSTILGSDKIVVMKEGGVEEMGPHEELLANRGLYADLFNQQFGKVISADQVAQAAGA